MTPRELDALVYDHLLAARGFVRQIDRWTNRPVYTSWKPEATCLVTATASFDVKHDIVRLRTTAIRVGATYGMDLNITPEQIKDSSIDLVAHKLDIMIEVMVLASDYHATGKTPSNPEHCTLSEIRAQIHGIWSKQRNRLFEITKPCIETGEFTLASGKKSNLYFDAKQVILTPEGSTLAADVILNELIHKDITAVGGLTSGADPIVSAIGVLSFTQGRPIKLFYARKEPKTHGTKKFLEGPPLEDSDRVAIIEDVVTTGKSAQIAIDRVAETCKAEIGQVITLVDREEGGYEAFGDKLSSVFRRFDFDVPPEEKI